jgi:hypothetical protein
MNRDTIFAQIDRERFAQDAQWGGAEHDKSHELFEWAHFIDKQNRLARQAGIWIAVPTMREEFETRMIKIAALAVAAIEASRNGA